MDNLYIQKEILLRTDVDDLPDFCSVNSTAQQICKSEAFWQEYFERAGLVLIETQKHLLNYITEFEYCAKALGAINEIIPSLKDRSDESTLILNTSLLKADDFEVNGIDIDKIRQIKLNDTGQREPSFDRIVQNPPKVALFFSPRDNKFVLRIISEGERYQVLISEDTLRSLLYVLSYHNYGFYSSSAVTSVFGY